MLDSRLRGGWFQSSTLNHVLFALAQVTIPTIYRDALETTKVVMLVILMIADHFKP